MTTYKAPVEPINPTTSACARHEGSKQKPRPSSSSCRAHCAASRSAMRVTSYQRLSSEAEGGARAAARAWAALRWAAAGVGRLYPARRRWAARRLCVARPLRAKTPARYEYDSASYARNFDDGTWMAEEGVSWHTRSFSACRLAAVQPS
ncbi:hypothetical protein BS78_02G225200 [Paspalum vaginatum]|nr:hypothetical protein BS78_02G225200 [Paspalum vaginatum]